MTHMVDQLVPRLIGWTLSAKSSEMGDQDEVQQEDGVDSQRPARRIEPWGHRGRAPNKVRTLWFRLGSSNVVFLGIAPSKGYGPADLEDGETALYCSVGGTEIRLDADGNITIDAASSKDVIVNGGTKKVARVDDTAKAGTLMATWMSQVETALNILAGGSVAPLSGTFATTPGIAVINAGADRFKG